MGLEEYYVGDLLWNNFVMVNQGHSLSGDTFEHADFKSLPPLTPEVVEILEVAVSYFGIQGTKSWLDRAIPALGGETPHSCLFEKTSIAMIHRMREYLVRLP